MRLAFSKTVVAVITDFEHAVAQVPDNSLHDAKGIVLRVHAGLWLELVQNSVKPGTLQEQLTTQLEAVARRAPNLDIYVVPDAHSAAESRPPYAARQGPRLLIDATRPGLSFHPVGDLTLAEIRQADLADVLSASRSRCVVCASANHHFALPSGAHANQFVRLSDAFVDIQTVDRVAYWIALQIQAQAPLMPTKPFALLVDHPSMLVLAARVQRLVSMPLEVVAFPTYPSDVETRTASFELLGEVASRCAAVFVAIGVASTGRLAHFISRWAEQASTVKVEVFVMYALLKLADAQVLCALTLPDYRHFGDAAACDLCAEHNTAVPVQASNHLVGYAPSEPVALGRDCFAEQRGFLERWGQYDGVLRVHYDDPNEFAARHHAFYVDVGTLLDIEDFRFEVVAAAKQFEPVPDVVVVPDHTTSNRLGTLVAQALDRPLVVLDATLVSRGHGAIDQTLYRATCALVIDDVFISGKRLLGINGFFREQRTTRVPNVQRVHYWTLLATPASTVQYRQAVRGLTSNHGWTATLGHLQQLILPDWHDASNCPWCMEYKVLRGLAQATGEFDGPLANRLSLLESIKDGIARDPFFVVPEDMQLPALGAESVVLSQGASSMQVLFACASALQQLRCSANRPLDANQFPAPSFLAVRNFSNNYTERFIWLGLLRSLKSKELEPDLKRFLSQGALDEGDGQRHIILGELAVAWLVGKLGAITVSLESRRFFEAAGITWASLYAKALVDREPS